MSISSMRCYTPFSLFLKLPTWMNTAKVMFIPRFGVGNVHCVPTENCGKRFPTRASVVPCPGKGLEVFVQSNKQREALITIQHPQKLGFGVWVKHPIDRK